MGLITDHYTMALFVLSPLERASPRVTALSSLPIGLHIHEYLTAPEDYLGGCHIIYILEMGMIYYLPL